jgi:hypothetical protein
MRCCSTPSVNQRVFKVSVARQDIGISVGCHLGGFFVGIWAFSLQSVRTVRRSRPKCGETAAAVHWLIVVETRRGGIRR